MCADRPPRRSGCSPPRSPDDGTPVVTGGVRAPSGLLPTFGTWVRHRLQVLVIAVLAYVPLLSNDPGRVVADTKAHLYLDPGRLLARAPSMWHPEVGLGTVTHQNIGFLWPIGPFYWLGDVLGLPDWLAQRLWMGSILLSLIHI